MKNKTLTFLKYFIGLLIAGSLLYYVFKDWDLNDLLERFKQVDYSWVLLSVFLSIISHVIRAYRWNLLLNPLGYNNLTTFRTFLAVMIGYFVNLLAPRAGEITRCGIMKKNDGVNMSVSLGSVVAERIVDLLGLMVIILLGLALQFDRLSGFMLDFFSEKSNAVQLSSTTIQILVALGVIIVISIVVLWWVRARIKRLPTYFKLRSFAIELYDGFTSVLKLKNKAGFWSATVLIWVFYFTMAYVVVFALPSTSHLGLLAGLSILIMGGLGMSAPVQGGFGTYHILVGSVLGLYGVVEKDGYFFATLIHSSQTLSILLFGGLSFIISMRLKKKKIN
ncbi:MAG: flippase-like domain-containing protein [Cyclobacteriaceae bacterium]|nr:flippase-like domain-containing protein [Cyclobacteriaceae bacterium]